MEDKLNVIVFGNVPLTTWVVKQIEKFSLMNLVGVVCEEYSSDTFRHHGLDEPNTYDFCKRNNLEIISFEEAGKIAKNQPILGLSVRYYKLFKQNYIDLFKPGILNFHGGELPRYRGINIANHIILESAENCAGTIHFVDKGIDTGDIVFRNYEKMNQSDTAHSCFIKTQECLKKSFLEVLNAYQNTLEIPRKSQQEYIAEGEIAKTYFKKDLDGKKIIEKNDFDSSTFDIKVRAFKFPGHEPAYLLKNETKYFITL